MVTVGLPLSRLCASISPSADSAGSWHGEAELHRNHRAAVVTALGSLVGACTELCRNRTESVWHSEMSGTASIVTTDCSMQPCERRKSKTGLTDLQSDVRHS